MIDRHTMGRRLIRDHESRNERIKKALAEHGEDSWEAWDALATAAGVSVVDLRDCARQSNEGDCFIILPRRTT